jgi:hypothetical protein
VIVARRTARRNSTARFRGYVAPDGFAVAGFGR